MKLINHEDQVSRSVDGGRLVEVIGIGTTAKGMMFKGSNVKTNARVPAGSPIGYILTEVNNNQTTLTIRFHRPGKIYENVYTVDMPLLEAAEYFELEGYDH